VSSFQLFPVLATGTVTGKALEAETYSVTPAEKGDGTCSCITTHKGNKEDPRAGF